MSDSDDDLPPPPPPLPQFFEKDIKKSPQASPGSHSGSSGSDTRVKREKSVQKERRHRDRDQDRHKSGRKDRGKDRGKDRNRDREKDGRRERHHRSERPRRHHREERDDSRERRRKKKRRRDDESPRSDSSRGSEHGSGRRERSDRRPKGRESSSPDVSGSQASFDSMLAAQLGERKREADDMEIESAGESDTPAPQPPISSVSSDSSSRRAAASSSRRAPASSSAGASSSSAVPMDTEQDFDEKNLQPLAELLPKRPAAGRSGRTCDLFANSFPVSVQLKDMTIYHLKFTPDIPEHERMRRIQLLIKIRKSLQTFYGRCIFDNTRILAFGKRVGSPKRFDLGTPGGYIDVSPVRHIDINNVTQEEQMQCLHMILRDALKAANYKRIGRNYHQNNISSERCEDQFSIPSSRNSPPINLWRGYELSIEPSLMGFQLKVDVCHRTLHKQSVLDLAHALVRGRRIPEHARKEIEDTVVGNAVLTLYNKRVWRVTEIDWNMTINDTFKKGDGEISYKEYFRDVYGVRLKHESGFMIINRPKKKKKKGPDKFVLPPELCFLTGLDKKMKSDFFFMKQIHNKTRIPPRQRHEFAQQAVRKIVAAVKTNNEQAAHTRGSDSRSVRRRTGEKKEKEVAQIIPITIDQRPVELKARTLEQMRVCLDQGNQAREIPVQQLMKGWRGQYSNERKIKIRHWALVFEESFSRGVDPLLREIQKMAKIQNLWRHTLDDRPRMEPVRCSKNDAAIRWKETLNHLINDGVEVLFCVTPKHFKNSEVYSAIKEVGCYERAVVTQCIQESLIFKGRGINSKLYQIVGSILRQIMTKMGNIPWKVNFRLPDRSIDFNSQIMVVGIDVNHDVRRNVATTAFCTCYGPLFTNYDTFVASQASGLEMLQTCRELMLDALRNYHNEYGAYPATIIVFRDGVSNSQLETVVRQEITKMRSAFLQIERELGTPYQPKLSVVVVQKRVSQKFVNRRMETPEPGTVVDTTVVSSEYWDFYLITCRPPRGCCATPTRYIVVLDDIGWTSDDLQSFVYQLSHLYYNWAGPIRVPAPVQVAHKTAHLWGTVIKKELKGVVKPNFQSGKNYML